ncbi:hypothetical protein [Sphingomonas alpina]|uniref:Uncharacterized protein n=1 Tax=Sphingomonas alpina TaxID=653931 RepID=A0A7H0LHW2_9SPHN|nr:hypothetical protein [Sphingomonas alpina]QNQ09265.1 hypothetical protein H3Z74_21765 [Sphingomonas alpina]
MRLYRTSAGTWAGTQPEADAAAKAEGSTWGKVEMPEGKAERIEWLNALSGPSEPQFAAPAPAPTPPPSPAPDTQRAIQQHNIRVEEEIANADFATATRLSLHILSRLGEHVRANGSGKPL